jgi:hypothetical protein
MEGTAKDGRSLSNVSRFLLGPLSKLLARLVLEKDAIKPFFKLGEPYEKKVSLSCERLRFALVCS